MYGGAEFVDRVNQKSVLRNIVIILSAMITFFFSIQLLGIGFRALGQETATSILNATSNPFIGLFIGLLVTAILQSSSTTTTMIVAAVASQSISLAQAIPIVLGANIGTTLTSTIVALSYITKTSEFRKAISAGTVHDIYNILVVLLLFPLELNYGLLTDLSVLITKSIPIFTGSPFLGILNFLDPVGSLLVDNVGGIFTLILAFVLLLATVKYISKILYDQWIGSAKKRYERTFFSKSYKSFGWGLVITSVIQSSSLSTSLIVPLVATGKIGIKRAFEFILGANLGTTITALLAAIFQSEAAISLALAHFIFNLFGVVIFLFTPFLSKVPTFLAERLGAITLRSRLTGLAYIIFTFFIIPFTLIYFSNGSDTLAEYQKTHSIIEKREGFLED